MSRSQLAGLKLLILAVLWQVALRCIEVYVYGAPSRLLLSLSGGHTLGLVPMAEQLASGSPGDVSVAAAWAQSFFALITQVLVIAIYGHVYIGCLRLLGFSVFRNTYKPLLAESIVEYWNRFYYYFKELLVHFFFYPTFLMGSVLSPTTRIFVSIVAAAFFGNLYYHIVRDFDIYLTSTPEQAFAILVPRLIYTGFLTAGIFISMLREKKRRRRRGNTNRVPAAVLVTRIRRILGVWVFYSFLLIWIEGSDFIPFGPRFEFLLAHFGISS